MEPNKEKPTKSKKPIKKPHQCERCSYRCQYPSDLKKHMVLHERRDNPDTWFSCDQCEFKTPYSYNFTLHKRGHTGEKPFKCTKCEYQAISKANLRIHYSRHHEARGKVKSYIKRIIKCQHCDFTTASYSTMKKHIFRHSNEGNPINCHLCDYGCFLKSQLRDHIANKHKSENVCYKVCDVCEYAASTRTKYKDHMWRAHQVNIAKNKYGVFKCNKCNETFDINHKLRLHKVNCSAKVPKIIKHEHKCSECDFVTHKESILQAHANHYHSSEKRRYKCPHCTFTTNANHMLVRHSVNHWPVHHHGHDRKRYYKCDKCDYLTTEREVLYRHLTTHRLDDKPDEELMHLCPVCGFKTDAAWRLAKHMLKEHQVTDLQPSKTESVLKVKSERAITRSSKKRACTNSGCSQKRQKCQSTVVSQSPRLLNMKTEGCSLCEFDILHTTCSNTNEQTHEAADGDDSPPSPAGKKILWSLLWCNKILYHPFKDSLLLWCHGYSCLQLKGWWLKYSSLNAFHWCFGIPISSYLSGQSSSIWLEWLTRMSVFGICSIIWCRRWLWRLGH